MTKSKNMDIDDVQYIIDRMKEGHIEAVLYGIKSDVPILNFNAVAYGAKYQCHEKEFIDALKNKFINSDITFFGMEMKSFVIAALDVLNVQKYTGNDTFIKQLITYKFQFY